MDTIDRILLPVDFTRIAGRALCHAAALAAQSGAELHVLHVARPGEGGSPEGVEDRMAAFLAEAEAESGYRFRDEAGAPVRGDVVVRRVVRYGEDVAQAVSAYAAEEGIDLLVVGTGGRADARQGFEERTAGKIARLAPCPVLTAGLRGLYRPGGLRRILVQVALNPASALALRRARALSARTGAHLVVLHVIDAAPWYEDPGADATMRAWDEVERAFEDLEAFYERVGGAGGPHLFVVRRGYTERDVMDFARRWDVDLIVQGPSVQGARGPGEPEEVAAEACVPCPVLLARVDREPSAGSVNRKREVYHAQ